jgi:hypothetical protein
MATLTLKTPTGGVLTNLAPENCAAGGDQFLNDGKTIIYLKNTNATTRTVTVATGGTAGGLAIADVAIAVVQNAEVIVGPFDPRIFNDANGYIQLTYTGVATLLTVAAVKIQ